MSFESAKWLKKCWFIIQHPRNVHVSCNTHGNTCLLRKKSSDFWWRDSGRTHDLIKQREQTQEAVMNNSETPTRILSSLLKYHGMQMKQWHLKGLWRSIGRQGPGFPPGFQVIPLSLAFSSKIFIGHADLHAHLSALRMLHLLLGLDQWQHELGRYGNICGVNSPPAHKRVILPGSNGNHWPSDPWAFQPFVSITQLHSGVVSLPALNLHSWQTVQVARFCQGKSAIMSKIGL